MLWIAVLSALTSARVLAAGPIGVPNTLQSGATAKAADVNANFTAVVTGVNANDARLTAIEAAVAGGNVVLGASTATAGNILKGLLPFVHNFGSNNVFVGVSAGNFAMTGTGNTGTGFQVLSSNTTGNTNTANGVQTLLHNTTGARNTAIGAAALTSNTTGNDNTAIGVATLGNNTTGSGNTATGVGALLFNTAGGSNTASGYSALQSNTLGSFNTGLGYGALFANTQGFGNTAGGGNALTANTIGNDNTAFGMSALFTNTAGSSNTAIGTGALQSSTTASNNTAAGWNALAVTTTGEDNSALGMQALSKNTTGLENTAIGRGTLAANTNGIQNTAVGAFALSQSTGSGNVAIGDQTGGGLRTGSGNIYIMEGIAVGDESHTIRFGNGAHTRTFIAGIRGVTTGASAIPVLVDTNGQLGTVSSSRRAKDGIRDMGKASAALMKLRPVTFYYKSDRGPEGRTLQYGMVAEEVNQVAPELVARSADGRIETVYYQFLAPMLVNEFQKQQRVIERQSAEIAELKRQTARLAAALARLDGRSTLAGANP